MFRRGLAKKSKRESVRESNALAIFFGGEKQTFGNVTLLQEILAFGFRCLEIIVFGVSEDVVERLLSSSHNEIEVRISAHPID